MKKSVFVITITIALILAVGQLRDALKNPPQTADYDGPAEVNSFKNEKYLSIPKFKTGAPSIFSDIFVQENEKMYLVNEQQQCDLTIINNEPDFNNRASFCALTKGFELRGWTFFNGEDHIIDAKSMKILSGNGKDKYPLPSAITNPSGLAADNENFWITDKASSLVYQFNPKTNQSSNFPSPASNPDSISFDGKNLWILSKTTVFKTTTQGHTLAIYTLPILASGFSVQPSQLKAWAVAKNENVIIRLDL